MFGFAKKIECQVCGRRFDPTTVTVYMAKKAVGPLESLTKAPEFFDAADCPKCGCQVPLAPRAARAEFEQLEDDSNCSEESNSSEAEGKEDGESETVRM